MASKLDRIFNKLKFKRVSYSTGGQLIASAMPFGHDMAIIEAPDDIVYHMSSSVLRKFIKSLQEVEEEIRNTVIATEEETRTNV